MGMEFYDNQIKQIENTKEIQSKFGKLINDYLKEAKNSEDSEFYLKGLIGQAKKLNNNEFNSLIEYINSKREKSSGDDKLQLLELWSTLNNTELKEQKELIGKKDFEIIGGKRGGYDFFGGDFDYLGNNKYKVFIDLKKRQNKYINYRRKESFLIEYNGYNTIKYYNNRGRYLGIGVIDHKQENISILKRKYNRIYKNSFQRGAIQRIHFKDLDLHLDLLFHEKEKTD